MRVVYEKPMLEKVKDALEEALRQNRKVEAIVLTGAEWDTFLREVAEQCGGICSDTVSKIHRRGTLEYLKCLVVREETNGY